MKAFAINLRSSTPEAVMCIVKAAVAVGHTVSGNQIRAGLLGDSKLVLLCGGDSLKAQFQQGCLGKSWFRK